MMIEYSPKTIWPLTGWRDVYADYGLHSAWYAGDPLRLATIYKGRIFNPFDIASITLADQAAKARRSMVHVPVAKQLAQTSAAWLFGEHPKVRVVGVDEENAPPSLIESQQRIEAAIEQNQLWSRISAAAEVCAALGAVVLKIDWDEKFAPQAVLAVAQVDSAYPEFWNGYLVACTFWKELEYDGDAVWRLLERRERGKIFNALYKGTSGEIGTQVDFSQHSAAAHLKGQEVIRTEIDHLLCWYVPNMGPNGKYRTLASGMNPNCAYIGRSDYLGSEVDMESLDEIYTSLMRDFRIGAGRIHVPVHMFRGMADGSKGFNFDTEIYQLLNSAPSEKGNPIEVTQFDIRTQQHLDAAHDLYRHIVTAPGYSPQSFGLDIQGVAESGTALGYRESGTGRTMARKADNWGPVLGEALRYMIEVEQRHLGGKAEPVEAVSVEMQDGIKASLSDLAQPIQLLMTAGAMSPETAVRKVNPDAPNAWVLAEVARIETANGVGVADPTVFGQDGGA